MKNEETVGAVFLFLSFYIIYYINEKKILDKSDKKV